MSRFFCLKCIIYLDKRQTVSTCLEETKKMPYEADIPLVSGYISDLFKQLAYIALLGS